MSKKQLSLAMVIVAIAGLAIYGYQYLQKPKTDTVKQATADKITVSYQSEDLLSQSLIDLAESKGYLKDNGIVLERKAGLKSITSYLTSGSVDVACNSLSVPLTDFYSGQNVKYLATISKSDPTMYIVSRYPLENVKSAVNVGVNRPGGTQQVLLSMVLKNLGVDTKSVKYVTTNDAPTGISLLQKKNIDIAVVNGYENVKRVRADKNLYMYDPSAVTENVNFPFGIVTTSNILKTKTNQLQRFVAALKTANDYFLNNKDEVIGFMASKYGMTKEDAASTYALLVKAKDGVTFSPDASLLHQIKDQIFAISKPSKKDRSIVEFFDPNFQ